MKTGDSGRKSRKKSRTVFALCTALLLAAPASADELFITDGDTVKLVRDDGTRERIRLEGIDAPEIEGADCPSERERGILAGAALAGLLKSGEVKILRNGQDRYGRTLARITITPDPDGAAGGAESGKPRDAGAAMIAAGHARPWAGRREDWCQEEEN